MPITDFSARFVPAIEPTAAGLPGIGDRMIAELRKGIRGIAALMAAELQATTPRSDTGSPHLADGWTTRELGPSKGGRDSAGRFVPDADFGVEIYNPRDVEVDAGGASTTLLQILEFGSRPHQIRPKTAKRLVFFWPAVGELVHAKSVEHPGTRPYAFMLGATESALARSAALLAAVNAVGQNLARRL